MKFKVGDKVRAINDDHAFTSKSNNWEGIVIHVYDYGFNASTTNSKHNYVTGEVYYNLNYDDFELVKSDPVYNADTLITELINNNLNVFSKVDFTYKIEAKKPILDDVEKEYLSNVIKPFRDRVVSIEKVDNHYLKEYLLIRLTNQDNMCFPKFKKGTMYKGMKVDKKYTLEELDL